MSWIEDVHHEVIHHKIKITPKFFHDAIHGSKTFEIRKNDRGYALNDYVLMQEFDSDCNEYTGNEALIKITYLTNYAQTNNYVVFAFRLLDFHYPDEPLDIDCDSPFAHEVLEAHKSGGNPKGILKARFLYSCDLMEAKKILHILLRNQAKVNHE